MIDFESSLKGRLSALDVSISLLAYLSGVAKTTISCAANGTASLGVEATRKLDACLRDLEDLVRSYKPARLDFRDARATAELLSAWRVKRARTARLAAKAADGPWELLSELVTKTPEQIRQAHGWTNAELAEKLAAANAQLHETVLSLQTAANTL